MLADAPAGAGTAAAYVSIQSDTVLVEAFATSVAGTLDIDVYGLTRQADGTEHLALLFSFPQLSSPTPELLLRRAAASPEQVKIVATYSAGCAYEVYVRAISSGAGDVRILGQSGFRVSQVDVSTMPVLLIAASLSDRSGLVLKNWATSGNLYVGDSASSASVGEGFPLAARDALAIELAAGVEVWGVADSGTIDVRIGEAGG